MNNAPEININDLTRIINCFEPHFIICILGIIFNPLWWNIVARLEYKTKVLTKIFGSNKLACWFMAALIILLGFSRDYLFYEALYYQPRLKEIDTFAMKTLAYLFYAAGSVLVASSMWKLGITGTYLGDYFGILFEEKIEGFPFNVMQSPMYTGSSMLFFAHAIFACSPAGIVLSAIVYIVYQVALIFEDGFTSYIYSQKNEKKN